MSNLESTPIEQALRAAGLRCTPQRVAVLDYLVRHPDHATVEELWPALNKRHAQASRATVYNTLHTLVEAGLVREFKLDDIPESLSTPAWLLDRWAKQYGVEAAQGIARASLAIPERYIRVGNAQPPAGAEPTEVPGCYRLQQGDPKPFRFQDISAQAVVPLLQLQPGQTFLDLCAAPGNKTAQAIETPVRAVAGEFHLSRARTLTPLEVPVVVLDARNPLPFSCLFDRILIDAPCSGTGTLARNPEIKWKLEPEDLPMLQERQIAILRNGLAQLAPGGLLVYSTCSLEREENEDVVAASGAQVIRTIHRLPGRDPGDGFFAAVLSR